MVTRRPARPGVVMRRRSSGPSMTSSPAAAHRTTSAWRAVQPRARACRSWCQVGAAGEASSTAGVSWTAGSSAAAAGSSTGVSGSGVVSGSGRASPTK